MANENTRPAIKEKIEGERETYSKVFQHWGGCFTRASRTSIPEDRWYDLTNLQPIGDANVRTINGLSAVLKDFAADTIYYQQYANLSGVDYAYSFATNGKLFQTRLSDGTTTQLNAGNLFSGANSQMDQWENLAVLFIDANGYYSWDGTTFTKITVAGAPSSGQCIAVYANRVWISQLRTLFVSVPANANGAGTGYGNNASDWTAANGSTFVSLVDPQIRGNLVRLISANGYLYAFTRSSINVLADVYVPLTSAGVPVSPPTPVFTNLNIQAIIGTDMPASVFAYNRSLMFANRYGAFALDGTTVTKLSDDIDGTWQYLGFTQSISGGQVVVNNLLSGAFLVQRSGDPIFGTNTVIAMWWANKWWFTNYGALTFVMSAFASNQPALFGLIGNKMYQLFANALAPPNASWLGPLWHMGDQLRTKEALKAGVELQFTSAGSITLNLDTENSSTPINAGASIQSVTWMNSAGLSVRWINNVFALITWYPSSYALYWTGTPGGYGKYLGISGKSSGTSFQLSAMMLDYAFGKRW